MKIININREETEKKICSIGAKKVFEGFIITVFFDYPDSSVKKAKNLIRLRTYGEKSYVTFKKYITNRRAKERQEYEVEVSDFKTMYSILTNLNLHPELEVKKQRTSYVLDDVHFEFDKHLDKYAYIPDFLEIETKDEVTLSAYIQRLGFLKNQCKAWSFFDIAEYYKP